MKKLTTFLVVFMSLLLVQFAYADDLEIFGGATVSLKPNVLIIFDNSGSMAGSKLTTAKNVVNAIINKYSNDVRFGLMVFGDNKNNNSGDNRSISEGGRVVQPCGASKTSLQQAVNNISANAFTPLAESLAEAGLYFAGQPSWFNAYSSNVTNLYNTADGGNYISPMQYPCQKNIIIIMTDGEPTADTSKIGNTNYINGTLIGNPDGDNCDPNGCDAFGNALGSNKYSSLVNVFGAMAYGSDYLDDVAYYLNHNDCNPSLGDVGDSYEYQYIQVHTIGFDIAHELLSETADHGGGQYISTSGSANPADALSQAFENILTHTLEHNAIYAPPAIPRNPDNPVQAGNTVYMPFFKPQADGRWIGNLKAYSLVDGVLKDAVSADAVYPADPSADDYVEGKEGYIKETAQSLWSWTTTNEKDGLNVDYGGAGKLMAERPLSPPNERAVFTYVGSNVGIATHPSNRFTATSNNNPQITSAMLAVSDATSRAKVIDETLRGPRITLTVSSIQDYWPMGDIIHSAPLVKYFEQTYQNGVIDASEATKGYLFVGANDGMLHVFNVADGQEKWAFIPPGQLSRLKYRSSVYSGTDHFYFVDGSPVIERVDDTSYNPVRKRTFLIFGERRGGSRYYALDINNPDTPVWRYQVRDNVSATPPYYHLGSVEARLGQSWATPQYKRIKSAGQIKDVFLMAGGYDTNQDSATPNATDSVGKSIYTIQADTGYPFGLNINAANWKDADVSPPQSYMTHSIVDVTGFDATESGYMNRVYAGDLGGNVFAAKYNESIDLWEKLLLIDLPYNSAYLDENGDSQDYILGQKFMTKPEATIETDGECIYIGTGDREHLSDTSRVDAFYTICNRWEKLKDVDGNDLPPDINGVYAYEQILLSDLADVTDNVLQDGGVDDADVIAALKTKLNEGFGWFMRMEHEGEKITSTPKVIDGKVFFTTFTPGDLPDSDPCTAAYNLGVSRLYVVDYRTGEAVMNLDDSDDVLNKEDRSIVIGTSLAPELTLTTIGSKTVLVTGSGGKLMLMDVDNKSILRRYYWRQVK